MSAVAVLDQPLSGELFAGTGMLGRAVGEVFGTRPAWFCEFDAAPSRVLAHHFPDVPNHGDVTKVDWATAPHVDILAGGFPCQDVSLAGARRGMKDGTRSGLWSEYVKAIDTLRPDWVVIENVRGLISARADSEVEPCPWCVGDGDDEYHLRALDAVLADLSRLGFDAEWTGLRAADVGAPHGRFRFFILAWPAERTVAADPADERRSLPVAGGRETRSRATESDRAAATDADDETGDGKRSREGFGLGGAEAGLTLLPTPVAQPSGNTPSEHLRKKPGRKMVTDLAIIAENGLIGSGGRLLPTPTVGNATGGNAQRGGDRSEEKLLPGIAVELATETIRCPACDVDPTAPHNGMGDCPPQGNALLPTPEASLGAHRRDYGQPPEVRRAGGHSVSTADAARGISDAGGSWGPYAAAIARWESVMGRPAPSPVRMDGKGGKARLNPELTEWMMGWPLGWVTASVVGLSRAQQLKACGNGVVLHQAVAALRLLLARPGVPPIEWAPAA